MLPETAGLKTLEIVWSYENIQGQTCRVRGFIQQEDEYRRQCDQFFLSPKRLLH